MKNTWRRFRYEELESRRVFTGPVDIDSIADDTPAIVDTLSSSTQAIGGLAVDNVLSGMFFDPSIVSFEATQAGIYWHFEGTTTDAEGGTAYFGGLLDGVDVPIDSNGYFSFTSDLEVNMAEGEVGVHVENTDGAASSTEYVYLF
jgi:hypothetical protein